MVTNDSDRACCQGHPASQGQANVKCLCAYSAPCVLFWLRRESVWELLKSVIKGACELWLLFLCCFVSDTSWSMDQQQHLSSGSLWGRFILGCTPHFLNQTLCWEVPWVIWCKFNLESCVYIFKYWGEVGGVTAQLLGCFSSAWLSVCKEAFQDTFFSTGGDTWEREVSSPHPTGCFTPNIVL
jgi:hypothetical protein